MPIRFMVTAVQNVEGREINIFNQVKNPLTAPVGTLTIPSWSGNQLVNDRPLYLGKDGTLVTNMAHPYVKRGTLHELLTDLRLLIDASEVGDLSYYDANSSLGLPGICQPRMGALMQTMNSPGVFSVRFEAETSQTIKFKKFGQHWGIQGEQPWLYRTVHLDLNKIGVYSCGVMSGTQLMVEAVDGRGYDLMFETGTAMLVSVLLRGDHDLPTEFELPSDHKFVEFLKPGPVINTKKEV